MSEQQDAESDPREEQPAGEQDGSDLPRTAPADFGDGVFDDETDPNDPER